MRSACGTTIRALAIALALAVAGSIAPAASLKSWRDGPVSALLTEDEYRQFGELRSDAARRTFIDQFWRDLQTETGGASNDYRETFERRCEAANARFEVGGQEGWRTDRGRVLLALGEPSSIRQEPGDANALEKQTWTYGTAGEAPDAPLRITFYRCSDGAYRLDPKCSVERDPTSVTFDDERASYLRTLRDENPTVDSLRLLSRLAGLLDPVPGGVPLTRSQPARSTASQPPPPVRSAVEPAPVHALDDSAYFFRAQDGTVLTLLTLALHKSDERTPPDPAPAPATAAGPAGVAAPAHYLGVVSIEESSRRGKDPGESQPRTVALDATPGDGGATGAVFLGRVYLHAGRTYAVRYAVEDGPRGEIWVRNAVVSVPDLSGGLSSSSIVPAERFGPAGSAPGAFQVGSEEVVPKPASAFKRSELLRLYLQVYDAAIDPQNGAPRVDVVFRFYRTGSGIAKRYGKPFSVRGAAGASMGLALPIGDWPAGAYRVEVELHDRVGEQRTTAEGRFTIAAD